MINIFLSFFYVPLLLLILIAIIACAFFLLFIHLQATACLYIICMFCIIIALSKCSNIERYLSLPLRLFVDERCKCRYRRRKNYNKIYVSYLCFCSTVGFVLVCVFCKFHNFFLCSSFLFLLVVM